MDAEIEAYLKNAREIINEYGFLCQAIFDPESGYPYTYTVGLSDNFNHPELIVDGVGNPDLQLDLLNAMANVIKEGANFLQPSFFVLPEYPSVTFASGSVLRFETIKPYVNAGRALLGQTFEAVQLYIPDSDGLMPWEAGVNVHYKKAQMQLFELPKNPPKRIMH